MDLSYIKSMKTNQPRQSAMDSLVSNYDKMMSDPKEYANTIYKSQINSLGRPYGGDRDARTKAVKKWDRNAIPV